MSLFRSPRLSFAWLFLVLCSPLFAWTFTTQPSSGANVAKGTSVTLTALAQETGNVPFRYQWYHRLRGQADIAIPGATGTSLSLSFNSPADLGQYYVVVTDTMGNTLTSTLASYYSVFGEPVGTITPGSALITEGGSADFSVSVLGGRSPYTYQWRFNGIALAGATDSTLHLSGVTQANVGMYDVVVSDDIASKASKAVLVEVKPAQPITDYTIDTASSVITDSAGARFFGSLRLASGKLLVWGSFSEIQGLSRHNLVRFNADATVDASFPDIAPRSITSLVELADGSLLIFGALSKGTEALARYSQEGVHLVSYAGRIPAGCYIQHLLKGPDGKVYVIYGDGTAAASHVERLDASLLPDPTYKKVLFRNGASAAYFASAPSFDAAGRLVLAGDFTTVDGVSRGGVARLLADGSLDAGFATNLNFDAGVSCLVTAADGGFYVGGYFTKCNGIETPYFVKLAGDGSLSGGLPSGSRPNASVSGISLLSNGGLVVTGGFSSWGPSSVPGLVLLSSGYSLDTAFLAACPAALWGSYYKPCTAFFEWVPVVDQAGRVLLGGALKAGTAGYAWVDSVSRQVTTGTAFYPEAPTHVLALASGKRYLVGGFNRVGSQTCNHIVRLNADRSLDAGFDFTRSGLTFSDSASYAVQSDGRLVICSGGKVQRLTLDGSLDASYGSSWARSGGEASIKALPGDRIAFFGVWMGENLPVILNPDGSEDLGFVAKTADWNSSSYIGSVIAMPDGGLAFGTASGNSRIGSYTFSNLLKVDAAGLKDASFQDPSLVPANWICSMYMQRDGSFMVPGARVSSTGQVLWMDISLGGYMRHILPLGDGSGLLLGKDNVIPRLTPMGYQSTYLGRIKPEGGLDSATSFPGDLRPNVYSSVISQNLVSVEADHSLFVVGLRTSGETGLFHLVSGVPTPSLGDLVPVDVVRGLPFTLTCPVNGLGAAVLEWFKDGKSLNRFGLSLSYDAATSDSAGAYQVVCHAAGGDLRSAVVQVSVSGSVTNQFAEAQPGLRVLDAASGSWVKSDHVVGVLNDRLVLSAPALAPGLKASSYQWTRNRVPLTAFDNKVELVIPHLASADVGDYAVTVSTEQGVLAAPAVCRVYVREAKAWLNDGFSDSGYGDRFTLIDGSLYAYGEPGKLFTLNLGSNGMTINSLSSLEALVDVAHGSSSTLALGSLGSVWTKTDLVNSSWVARDGLSSAGGRALAYGAGVFVAVNEQDLLYSADGASWTPGQLSDGTLLKGSDCGFTDVTFGGGRFMAVSNKDGRSFLSTDGIHWTVASGLVYGSKSVAYGSLTGVSGQVYVVSDGGGRLFYSADGSSWSKSRTYGGTRPDRIHSGYLRVDEGVVVAGRDELPAPVGDAATAKAFAYYQGRYFAQGGDSGRILVATSAQAAQGVWTNFFPDSGDASLYRAEATDGTHFVAVGSVVAGSGPASVFRETYSSDGGRSFDRLTLRGSDFAGLELNGVAFGAARFVAVGTGGRILGSPDGSVWTAAVSGVSSVLNSVVWTGNRFVAVGAAGVILSSPDGVVWTKQLHSLGSVTFNAVAFGAGRHVAVGASGVVASSTDGVTWTAGNSTVSSALTGVAFSLSGFAAVSESGDLLRSLDGLSWTPINVGFSHPGFSGISFAGGVFNAFYAETGPSRLYLQGTFNMVRWDEFPYTNIACLRAAASSGGNLLVAGRAGRVFSSTVPALKAELTSSASSVLTGSTVTLTVDGGVQQSGISMYVWYKLGSGGLLDGGRMLLNNYGPTASLANVTSADAGTYVVYASSASGLGVFSSPVTLTVTTPVAPPVVVVPPTPVPTIVTQPADVAILVGGSASFSVSANDGVSYQWFKDGVELAGATGYVYSLSSVSLTDAGTYSVRVKNSSGSVLSRGAFLTVAGLSQVQTVDAPVLRAQPSNVIGLAGGSASFGVLASGTPAPGYQWRFNGLPISGATASTLSLSGLKASDAGFYDVVVSNGSGSVVSVMAQLTVQTKSVAPVIEGQPVGGTFVLGRQVSLQVSAVGAPAPSYRWFKDGVVIAGAVSRSLVFASIAQADAGSYQVEVSNSAGSVVSNVAPVQVLTKSYAGTYTGALGSDGVFSLLVRDDNSGVFLGYLNGGSTPFVSLDISVAEDGTFTFSVEATKSVSSVRTVLSSPVKVSGVSGFVVSGKLSRAGVLDGTLRAINGDGTISLSATKASGSTLQAGFYEAQASGGSGVVYTIISPAGSVLAVGADSAAGVSGLGSLKADGTVVLSSGGDAQLTASVKSSGSQLQVKLVTTGGTQTVFTGAAEAYAAGQRLVNLSSRSFSGANNQVAIAGFVVGGSQNKLVLLRAVGPTLGKYGVSGTLKAPTLELYRGSERLAYNKGWATSENAEALVSAAQRAGAFALSVDSADSALLVSLPPGGYTAMAKGDSETGVALVETYDLSEVQAGQHLLNISTRAWAGLNDKALIAGFVVGGWVPKRVLLRAVGPTLAGYGLPQAELLAHPKIRLFRDQTLLMEIGAWGGNANANASLIKACANAVGAFPLSSDQEAAIVLSLDPGVYSAQVVGADGGTGIAIMEVYEVE